jgi:hypothetical protein
VVAAESVQSLNNHEYMCKEINEGKAWLKSIGYTWMFRLLSTDVTDVPRDSVDTMAYFSPEEEWMRLFIARDGKKICLLSGGSTMIWNDKEFTKLR